MSIATEIARIQTGRNTIRAKLVELGLAQNADNLDKLAAQVARFLYEVGRADPDAIKDLKPRPDMHPGYMFGWCQGDVCDNFIIDIKTMTVRAFIDWEDARFCDFSYMFNCEKRTPAREFMNAVRVEYDRLWNKDTK